MLRKWSVLAIVIGPWIAAAMVYGGDWPQFRGPGGSGVTMANTLPTEWSGEQHIAWKAAIPGVAWSQPVVWGGKIYVTTAVTENQQKPRAGFGGFGGPPGFGGRRGPGGPDGAREPGRPGDAPPASDDDRRPPRGERAPGRQDQPDRSGRPTDRPAGSPDGGGGPPDGPGGRPGGRPGGFGGRFGGPGGFGTGGDPPNAVYQWKLLCLDAATGDVVWEQMAHEGKPTIPTHGSNTYASETPIIDGERVYAYFGMTGVFCFDLSGKPLWNKEIGSYPMMAGWGTGSSPALDAKRIFVQCDNEKESFLVALDKFTGEELWRAPRDVKSSWSTPLLWKNKLREELVVCGGKGVWSHDPATGAVLWKLDGLVGQFQASPVADSEQLYVGAGNAFGSRPLCAIRAGASGDIEITADGTAGPGVAWYRNNGGPSMASPLLYEGRLYVVEQRGGILACYDAKTGEQVYRERLPEARGFTSSPWAAGGKVYCLDEDGTTFVVQSGPEMKLLSTNKLDDMFWSSAAVAGDRLLLRGVNHLYCIAP